MANELLYTSIKKSITLPYGVATQQKIGEMVTKTNTTMMLHWKVSYYYYSTIRVSYDSLLIPNDLLTGS
jgi:hypothetical protein